MPRGDPARRALSVLQILSDGRVHSLHGLACAVRVSPRTIRRDLEILDTAGFAIERDTSKDGRTVFQLVNPSNARKVLAKRNEAIA